MAVRVGVLGLGMMGATHLQAYRSIRGARPVAVADSDLVRLHGELKAWSNVESRDVSLDLGDVRRFADSHEMLQHPDVDLVDVCLPTDLHAEYAVAALRAGKHVVVEKPLARNTVEATTIMEAERGAETDVFVGHCMRFWPGWDCLKDWLQVERFGPLFSAHFARLAAHPGGPFYSDDKRTGGALLDLHIHDTDFVQFCFGLPQAVTSYGVKPGGGAIDHVVTHYHYDDSSMIVSEGAWFPSPGFKFSMSYRICCQDATLVYLSQSPSCVKIYATTGEVYEERLEQELGYGRELAYFIQCVEQHTRPQTVTLQSAWDTLRIIEAEHRSIETKSTVKL